MTERKQTNTIIVHHSAGTTTATVEEIRRQHRARGFSDIGYHFVVRQMFADGPWTVEAGRPLDAVGAHDADQNSDSVGVCLLGDYSKGPIHGDAWVQLLLLVQWLLRRYGLTVGAVEGHREHEPADTPTLCPGFDPTLLRLALQRGGLFVTPP